MRIISVVGDTQFWRTVGDSDYIQRDFVRICTVSSQLALALKVMQSDCHEGRQSIAAMHVGLKCSRRQPSRQQALQIEAIRTNVRCLIILC